MMKNFNFSRCPLKSAKCEMSNYENNYNKCKILVIFRKSEKYILTFDN